MLENVSCPAADQVDSEGSLNLRAVQVFLPGLFLDHRGGIVFSLNIIGHSNYFVVSLPSHLCKTYLDMK